MADQPELFDDIGRDPSLNLARVLNDIADEFLAGMGEIVEDTPPDGELHERKESEGCDP